MIEAFATVISHQNGVAKVEYIRSSACGHCEHETSCSMKDDGESKQQLIDIPCELNLIAGQQVRIGIPENSLVKGAFFAYMVPLICVLTGAAIGSLFDSSTNELSSILGALFGGIVGFVILKMCSSAKRMKRYQPVILGVAIPIATHF